MTRRDETARDQTRKWSRTGENGSLTPGARSAGDPSIDRDALGCSRTAEG